MLFAAAGGLVLVLLIAVLGLVMSGGDGGAAPVAERTKQGSMGVPADSGTSPDSYSDSPTTEAYAGIGRRSADAEPLTIEESFPDEAETITVADAKAKLTLKGKSLDGDCAKAIWGSAVGAVLRQGGCTQAVRGLYADTKRGYALSVTVFNLAEAEDANRVVDALGTGRGGGFVAPLTGAAPLDVFGDGFSMARGLAMGHYAVVAWAERLDGKGTESDEDLLSLLIEGGQPPAVLARAARTS